MTQLVPFRFLRVTYVYSFRFTEVHSPILKEISQESLDKDLPGYKLLRNDHGSSFQPFLKMPSTVVSLGTPDIKWRWYDEYRNINAYKRISEDLEKLDLYVLYDREPTKYHRSISPAGLPVRIRKGMTLDQNGVGTCCISLILHQLWTNQGLCLSQCLNILNMAEDVLSSKEEKGSIRRFALCPVPSGKTQRESTPISLPQLAAQDIAKFLALVDRLNKNARRRSPLWLCRDGDGDVVEQGLLEIDKECVTPDCPDGAPYQNPYIYTEMECSSLETYKELFKSNEESPDSYTEKSDLDTENPAPENKGLRKLLSQMLIRVGPTGLKHWSLNLDYLAAESAGPGHNRFPNSYPAGYLHIWPHFRSTLVLFPPLDVSNETTDVARAVCRYLLALRDTVREVRSRWHFLVSEHAYVDVLLRNLRDKWAGRKNLRAEFVRVQRRLLDARFDTTMLLENPIVYRRAASSLNALYSYLENSFGSKEMQISLVEKLAQSKHVYDECVRINIIEQD